MMKHKILNSPQQQELFELDPKGQELRDAYLPKLPHSIRHYFEKMYLRRLRKYGMIHATEWFKAEMQRYMPRIKLVLNQYSNVLTILKFTDINSAENSDLLPEQQTVFLHQLTNVERQLYQFSDKELQEAGDKIGAYFFDKQDAFLAELERLKPDNLLERVINFFKDVVVFCHKFSLTAPYAKAIEAGTLTDDQIESFALKIISEKYWYNQLKRAAKRMREHLMIAVGEVQLGRGGYVSNERLQDWKSQKKANYEYIKSKLIENLLDPDEQLELLDIYLKSNANPAKRRTELMTRMRGFEDWADERDYNGLFITLTAPSKYHAMLFNGLPNPKWNGACPITTQRYLCSIWAKIRAALARRNIEIFGFRVAEPHHDATPHWHMLLYVQPKYMEELKQVITRYALAEDSNEEGAAKHRCKFEAIDPSKGSATGYIAKYISKNIDGYALENEKDDETGMDMRERAKRACAWASLWNIRQFQQFGGAPVSVWRELRRLGNQSVEDEIVEELRIVADVGCWASYCDRQGGCTAKRADLKARLHYLIKPELNQYNEEVKKIDGIKSCLGQFIPTRLKGWAIKSKPQTGSLYFSRSETNTWSSVNNCTQNQNDKTVTEPPENLKPFYKANKLVNIFNKNRRPDDKLKLNNFELLKLGSGERLTMGKYDVMIINGYLVRREHEPDHCATR